MKRAERRRSSCNSSLSVKALSVYVERNARKDSGKKEREEGERTADGHLSVPSSIGQAAPPLVTQQHVSFVARIHDDIAFIVCLLPDDVR